MRINSAFFKRALSRILVIYSLAIALMGELIPDHLNSNAADTEGLP
ncbi:hypothetical protein IQ268_29415 [Oculatella sp. LEGE 06141]|nr:hypothetical protein [Oculatella sp. LEGE 06141]MBE9182661.1 hypothetical protein [Oculatella sp. LEGE 06141]